MWWCRREKVWKCVGFCSTRQIISRRNGGVTRTLTTEVGNSRISWFLQQYSNSSSRNTERLPFPCFPCNTVCMDARDPVSGYYAMVKVGLLLSERPLIAAVPAEQMLAHCSCMQYVQLELGILTRWLGSFPGLVRFLLGWFSSGSTIDYSEGRLYTVRACCNHVLEGWPSKSWPHSCWRSSSKFTAHIPSRLSACALPFNTRRTFPV